GALLHGEAVAIGMHMAALLAQSMGRVDREVVERQRQLLTALALPAVLDDVRDRVPPERLATELLWRAMQHDKKVQHGVLRFILPNRIGEVELVAGIHQDMARAAIDAARG